VSKSNARLPNELRDLAGFDTDVLRQRWAELYGMIPAPRISRDVLIRGVAHRIQENARGGPSKALCRQLKRLANALREGGTVPASHDQSFKLGTRLVREWKGKVHEVVVAGESYIWAGKHYRSLSQIARSITGTRWSGPRFFGLGTAGQTAAAKGSQRTHARAGRAARDPFGSADG